jgi:Protein kinase domain/CHASE2 domain
MDHMAGRGADGILMSPFSGLDMDVSRFWHRKIAQALGIGLLAATLASAPPLRLVERLDRALYDANSRLAAGDPPADVLLVDLDDPAWCDALASLAYRHQARLLVSTLPQPPSLVEPGLIGPTAIAFGGAAVLHPTAWRAGGHLWLAADTDGVIRYDRPVLDDGSPLPSLGLAGALSLLGEHARARVTSSSVDAGTHRFAVDAAGRRWLRFYRPAAFREATPRQITRQPELLADRIVVAGRGGAVHPTPLGPLSTRELVAELILGYWQNRAITTGFSGHALGWAVLGLVLIAALFVSPAATPRHLVIPAAASTAALVTTNVAAFQLAGLWVPITAPLVFAATALGYWHWSQDRTSLAATLGESANGDLESREPVKRGATADPTSRVSARTPAVEPAAADTPSAEPCKGGAAGANASMPSTLGRYELLECIGHGAMGSVFLGRDPTINRRVAIKAIDLTTEFDVDEIEAAGERFLREAETAGRLNHPNIVTIFDAGRVGGIAYIAMEYLQGSRLSEHAEPATLLPATLVLELMARAAEALSYAHSHNVVHRDIKPANIMYDSASDSLKITDFGIARWIDVSRTRTGIVLGTPSFMSPEQLEGKNVNGHTDLFALGITLYQLLTGLLPFRGTSMTQLMFVIANEPHAPLTAARPELPESLDAILDRALAKDPADRFGAGDEMAGALRQVAAGLL